MYSDKIWAKVKVIYEQDSTPISFLSQREGFPSVSQIKVRAKKEGWKRGNPFYTQFRALNGFKSSKKPQVGETNATLTPHLES